MADKMRVLLVGGRVEWNEMVGIARGLREAGYKAFIHKFPNVDGTPEDIDGLLKRIDKVKPDIVFPRKNAYPNPRAHDVFLKIGTIYVPEHMQKLGIPVVGSTAEVIKTLRNKAKCDTIMRNAGAPFANDFILIDPNGRGREYGTVLNNAGFTRQDLSNPFKRHDVLFIKPNSLGRSAGITDANVLHNMDELVKRSKELVQEVNGANLIVTPFYHGSEFTVGVIGNKDKIVLPVQVCQQAGYSQNQILLQNVKRGGIPTGKIFVETIKDFALVDKLREYSLAASKVLGINDYTRMDFRRDAQGQYHVLDVNGVAGLKVAESYISVGAQRAFEGQENGCSIYARLVSTIVSIAAERYGLNTNNCPTLFGLENKLLSK